MQTLQNVSDLAKILLRETEIGRNDSKPWAPKQGLDVEIDRISCWNVNESVQTTNTENYEKDVWKKPTC